MSIWDPMALWSQLLTSSARASEVLFTWSAALWLLPALFIWHWIWVFGADYLRWCARIDRQHRQSLQRLDQVALLQTRGVRAGQVLSKAARADSPSLRRFLAGGAAWRTQVAQAVERVLLVVIGALLIRYFWEPSYAAIYLFVAVLLVPVPTVIKIGAALYRAFQWRFLLDPVGRIAFSTEPVERAPGWYVPSLTEAEFRAACVAARVRPAGSLGALAAHFWGPITERPAWTGRAAWDEHWQRRVGWDHLLAHRVHWPEPSFKTPPPDLLAVVQARVATAQPITSPPQPIPPQLISPQPIPPQPISPQPVSPPETAVAAPSLAALPPAAKTPVESVNLAALVEAWDRKVIGQQAARTQMQQALQIWSLGLRPSHLPRVLVLVGPTQTGKTLAARTLAEALGPHTLFLPMSGYRSSNEGFGLTGMRRGYSDARPGDLTRFLAEHPKGTVILDQLDLAHERVQVMLQSLFVDGTLEDAHGLSDNETRTLVSAAQATILVTLEHAGRESASELAALQVEDPEGLMALLREGLEKPVRVQAAERSAMQSDEDAKGLAPTLGALLASQVLLPMTPLRGVDLLEIARRRLGTVQQHLATRDLQLTLHDPDTLALVEILQQAPDIRPAELERHVGDGLLATVSQYLSDPKASLRQLHYAIDPDAQAQLQALSNPGLPWAEQVESLVRRCFRRREQLRVDGTLQSTDLGMSWRIDGLRFERVRTAMAQAGDIGLTLDLPQVRFDQIYGQEGVKQRLQEVLRLLRAPALEGQLLPRGMMLMGRPGTGKTLLAKALAAEADLPFLALSGPQLLSPDRVSRAFALARQFAPSILFLDEIDALGVRARGGHVEAINQLLTEIDGFKSSTGLFVVAATNHPDNVDPAIVRSGRLDLHMDVPPLDREARQRFLEQFASLAWADGVWAADLLEELVDLSSGMTGADVAKLKRELALLALRQSRSLTRADAYEQLHIIKYGAREARPAMSAEHRQALAYHEAGHVVASYVLNPERPIEKVSIIARAGANGFMALGNEVEHYVPFDRQEVIETLCVLLAGRIAEQRCRAEQKQAQGRGPDAGDVSDLQRATAIAWTAVTQWGMDESFGWLSVDPERQPLAPALTELAVARQQAMLQEARLACEQLLQTHRRLLDAVAHALLQQETLSGASLYQVLSEPGGAR